MDDSKFRQSRAQVVYLRFIVIDEHLKLQLADHALFESMRLSIIQIHIHPLEEPSTVIGLQPIFRSSS